MRAAEEHRAGQRWIMAAVAVALVVAAGACSKSPTSSSSASTVSSAASSAGVTPGAAVPAAAAPSASVGPSGSVAPAASTTTAAAATATGACGRTKSAKPVTKVTEVKLSAKVVGYGGEGRPVPGLVEHLTQHGQRVGLCDPEPGDVQHDRFRRPGQHVEQRGTHRRDGAGVEHPGQPDQWMSLAAVHQVTNLARHDRSIVPNADPSRISASGDRIPAAGARSAHQPPTPRVPRSCPLMPPTPTPGRTALPAPGWFPDVPSAL